MRLKFYKNSLDFRMCLVTLVGHPKLISIRSMAGNLRVSRDPSENYQSYFTDRNIQSHTWQEEEYTFYSKSAALPNAAKSDFNLLWVSFNQKQFELIYREFTTCTIYVLSRETLVSHYSNTEEQKRVLHNSASSLIYQYNSYGSAVCCGEIREP